MMAVTDVADDVRLYVPERDVEAPVVTILVPSLNEELTIEAFIRWCHEGIAASGTSVEILIVDSSTDRTREIALANGARVLDTPKRGLGRAYIDAIPYVRGKFIIMGDADCTYDFRVIKPYIDAYDAGAEFVMGSRFRGSIEPGAMPKLHRYFGTPLTTFILNTMFSSHYTDIHCGMRGITRDALERMEMSSQGWEYASEMVLKSVHMKLRTSEVPINFLKDPEGRLSHMKRRGWMEPWRAGWMNLRAMLTYGVDFFLIKPGAALLLLGLLFLVPLTFGPFSIGVLSFSLNTMLLAMVLATLGVSMLYSGIIASVLFDYSDTRQPGYDRIFAFNRTVAICLMVGLVGVLLAVPLVRTFVSNGFSLRGVGIQTHHAVAGLWLITTSFQTFIFMLMIRALGVVLPKRAQATVTARRGEPERKTVRISTERP